MAYSFTLNSEFKPLSFAERIAPLQLYKEEWDKKEQAYSDLLAQTETWKDIANQENSPEAYAMYKRYSDDLSVAADNLMRSGLDTNTGRSLLGLKRRYYQDIEPISKASEALDKAIQYREEALSKDPSAVFVKNYSSVDDFLHGKRANNEYVSGKELTSRVALKAEKMGKALFSDPEFKQILGGQKYQAMIRAGYTPDMLLKVLENDPEASPYLDRIYKDELNSIGIDRFNDIDKMRLVNAAQTGMYAGLQQPATQFLDNKEYMSAAERDASARGWAGINLQEKEYNRKLKEQEDEKLHGKLLGLSPDGKREVRTNGIDVWEVPLDDNSNKAVISKRRDGAIEYIDQNGKSRWVTGDSATTKEGKVRSTVPLPDGSKATLKSKSSEPINVRSIKKVYDNDDTTKKNLKIGDEGRVPTDSERKKWKDKMFTVWGNNIKEHIDNFMDADEGSFDHDIAYNRLYDPDTGITSVTDIHGNTMTISPLALDNIKIKLSNTGFTLNDIRIYADHDNLSNNNFRIVSKYADPYEAKYNAFMKSKKDLSKPQSAAKVSSQALTPGDRARLNLSGANINTNAGIK